MPVLLFDVELLYLSLELVFDAGSNTSSGLPPSVMLKSASSSSLQSVSSVFNKRCCKHSPPRKSSNESEGIRSTRVSGQKLAMIA